jgi:TonB family protein
MSWLAFLAQNALRGTIVLTAALAAAVALRHASAALRSLVWTSACAALLALPLAVLVVPKWSPPPRVMERPADGAARALPLAGVATASAWQTAAPAPVSRGRDFNWLAKLWALGGAAAGAWLFKAQPVYPADLRLAGIEGTVVVRAVISKDGEVLNPQAETSDVHPRLIEAALEAVRKWKYRPTLLNGQPVETPTDISIVFSLQ